jgi:hypothetical protein
VKSARPRAGHRHLWAIRRPARPYIRPYKTYLLWETLRAVSHPGRARTVRDLGARAVPEDPVQVRLQAVEAAVAEAA